MPALQRCAPLRHDGSGARPTSWSSHKLIKGIGPEPLGNAFSGPILAAALKGKKTSIKVAILDQKVVAGVGNIYASEALFRAGISPKRLRLYRCRATAPRSSSHAIKTVLNEAIAAGGSSLAGLCPGRWRARLFPAPLAGL